MAKSFLDRAGIGYTVVDAEEQADLVRQYSVSQAPTLVIAYGDRFEKYINASNIKRYAENGK
jgi:ribonucleoside-triphosphate reductase